MDTGHVPLGSLAARVGGRVLGNAEVAVAGITHDSRSVAPGTLFCCVRGEQVDGHAFAAQAVEAGAVALLADHDPEVGAPVIVVEDVRTAMGPASSAVYGDPSADLTIIGVTGTNGKTTTTHLLGSIAASSGRRSAVLGTLSGPRTTPEAPELQRWLAERVREGIEIVAMEVSSHALDQHRVLGTRFTVAVFTNLSPDHLDHHHSMEAYFAAKRRLFEPDLATLGVVHVGTPWGERLAASAAIPVVEVRDTDATEVALEPGAVRFVWRDHPVRLALGGRFNVANALCAAEAARLIGLEPSAIAAGLSAAGVVPGRFERVEAGQGFLVVVDFAHTPDALDALLRAADEVAAGRVHVVFGCGGERDPAKRAAMGRLAAGLADRVVLTADNSRGEATEDIIDAIVQGYGAEPAPRSRELLIEPDRRRAIALALEGAEQGDAVVIAGKGHETTQTTAGRTVAFDDREVARSLLEGAP